MYKFEKMFKDNADRGLSETDPELPRAIGSQIERFRAIQAEITANPNDAEGNAKRKAALDELDEKIMKTLPDFFEIEDEAETQKQEKLKKMQEKLDKRAALVGLPAGSTEDAIVAAEKAAQEKQKEETKKRQALDARAKKVGLAEGSSEADIKAAEDAAEKKKKEDEDNQKSEAEKRKALDARAAKVGLAAGAAEADIVAAEKAADEKNKKDEDAPATTNAGALEKLFKKGKTSVTIAELKAAGLNTGFFGVIGPNGWNSGAHRIYRDDPNSDTFTLSKVG